MKGFELIRYDAARLALQAARRVDEVKDIRDKAQAMAAYARQAKDKELIGWATEIKVLAERRAGELLKDMGLHPGPKKDNSTLLSIGVSLTQSSRWQKLAAVPDAQFQKAIAAAKEIAGEVTTAAMLRLSRENKKRKRVEDVNEQKDELAKARPSAPRGLFNVIVVDPPWPYEKGASEDTYDPAGRRAANPYPEISLEDLESIKLPTTEDCVLWLWTTHKFMRHAFPILDTWGFEDKAIVTWVKDRMGLGRWLRSQSEFCIMAVKGNPVITLTNQTTIIQGPMRQHSRKPDEFYAMVDSLCHGRKLDYFSRETREGWEQYGDEIQKFAT